MAKSHYTADSPSPPRLMTDQRRPDVAGSRPVPTVRARIDGADTTTPHSFIV